MTIRVPFNGGCLMLAEPVEFIGKTGNPIHLDYAVVVVGASTKTMRLPLDIVDAIIGLRENDQYQEYRKKARQPKP